MIVLVHGAVGAACGMIFRRPGPTVAAALISHFAVDAIAHEEPVDENRDLRLDVIALDGLLLGLAILLVVRRQGPLSAQALGALAASLPDGEHLGGRRGLGEAPVHAGFPHAAWPSKRVSLRRQFLIGVAAWLALLKFRPGAR